MPSVFSLSILSNIFDNQVNKPSIPARAISAIKPLNIIPASINLDARYTMDDNSANANIITCDFASIPAGSVMSFIKNLNIADKAANIPTIASKVPSTLIISPIFASLMNLLIKYTSADNSPNASIITCDFFNRSPAEESKLSIINLNIRDNAANAAIIIPIVPSIFIMFLTFAFFMNFSIP